MMVAYMVNGDGYGIMIMMTLNVTWSVSCMQDLVSTVRLLRTRDRAMFSNCVKCSSPLMMVTRCQVTRDTGNSRGPKNTDLKNHEKHVRS